jgi:hypothetical protein
MKITNKARRSMENEESTEIYDRVSMLNRIGKMLLLILPIMIFRTRKDVKRVEN